MGGRRGRAWAAAALVIWLALGSSVGALPASAPLAQDAEEHTVAIGYQGVLTDSEGQPLTGAYPMEFRLYSARSGGVPALWSSGILDVAVDGGLFQVVLQVPQGLLDGRTLWMAIYVDGETLSPRQEILATPYAAGLLPNIHVQGATSGNLLSATNLSTGAALWGSSVRGAGVYGLSEDGYGVYGENAGTAQGAGYGGYFISSTGVGVYGHSDAESTLASPLAPGVQGSSQHGYGVYGQSAAATRAGVMGVSTYGGGVRGESTNGAGLEGYSVTGPGLRATSEEATGAEIRSTQGPALVAETEGVDAGDHAGTFSAVAGSAVVAESSHSAGVQATSGDVALAPAFSGLGGVIGRGETLGVYGSSHAGTGVEGASVNGIGVRGSSQGHYGGYFTSTGQRALYVENLDGKYWDAYFGGEVGIRVAGGADVRRDLTVGGDARIDGNLVVSGSKSGYVADIALHAGEMPLERGDLVEVVGVADPVAGEIPVPRVRRTEGAESRAVLGVVDRRYVPGEGFASEGEGQIAPGEYLGTVTLGAYAVVNADATYGAILPGDLLVSSPTPGHAMRAEDPQTGTVVGKALEALESGRGRIAVVVTLQ